MTSRELNDNNALKADGVVMKIWEPELIVLPIPENTPTAITPVEIDVFITNNTQTTFPFVYGILTPELVGADGQALQPQKRIDRQITTSPYDGIGIPLKKSLSHYLTAKLSWHNNRLQLQGTSCDYLRVSTNPDPNWYFEVLQLGSYQIRVTYSSPDGEFSFIDASTGDIIRAEGDGRRSLATPFVNLRLVEPVGADKSAVEVDGIRFETVVPQTWSISLSQSNASSSVQIGICITNNTLIPQHFCSFTTLIPALRGADGLILGQQLGGGSLGWIGPRESDFHLVMPEESVTFFLSAHIEKRTDGLLNLIFSGGGRGYWLLSDLKLGTYQVQLTYRSLTNKLDMRLFEDFWRGMVHTPFVKFSLVQP